MTDQPLRIRVVLPDLWREEKMEFKPSTPVRQVKKIALPRLLGENKVDPDQYYVEVSEREILDEGRSLADLGVSERGVLFIRPYDLDHPPPFRG